MKRMLIAASVAVMLTAAYVLPTNPDAPLRQYDAIPLEEPMRIGSIVSLNKAARQHTRSSSRQSRHIRRHRDT